MIILTYGAGLFFLVGPYAAIQYFMAECYPVSCRATGTAFIGAMSQPGTILGGALFTCGSRGGNRCGGPVGRRGRNPGLRPADDRRQAAGRGPARGSPP